MNLMPNIEDNQPTGIMFRDFNNIYYTRENNEFFVYLFRQGKPVAKIPDIHQSMISLVADKWYIKQSSNRTMVQE